MFWDQNVTINYCVSSQIPKGEKIGRRSFKETKQRFCSEESSCCGHQGAALFGGTDQKCLRNEIIIDFQPKSSNDNRRFSLSLTFLIRSRFDLFSSQRRLSPRLAKDKTLLVQYILEYIYICCTPQHQLEVKNSNRTLQP